MYISNSDPDADLSSEFSITINKVLLNGFNDIKTNTLAFDWAVGVVSRKQNSGLNIYSYQNAIYVKSDIQAKFAVDRD